MPSRHFNGPRGVLIFAPDELETPKDAPSLGQLGVLSLGFACSGMLAVDASEAAFPANKTPGVAPVIAFRLL